MTALRLSALILAGMLAAPAPAQTTPTNVGLTMGGFGLQFGVVCGPFQCSYVRGILAAGSRVTVSAYGTPGTPYAVAIGLPSNTCVRVLGIRNGLLLRRPIITHIVGMIGRLDPNLPCRQGRDSSILGIPPGLSGFQFAVQSVGIDSIGPAVGPGPAFSNPLLVGVR